MEMQSIQVDEEVLAYLKERAEPFVDSPNSVLRRELLGKRGSAVRSVDTATVVPRVRAGTPQALTQLLQVAHLVTQKGMSRTDATKLVAKFHRVAPQTVNDKYGRQADLNASRFDRLLTEPDLASLRSHMLQLFPQHRDVIDELLQGNGGPGTDTPRPLPRSDVTGLALDREPLTYTMAGYLVGRGPKGDRIAVWHEQEGRTGYHLHWNNRWHERFGQDEMEEMLGISVRVKRSGSQEGYPSEAVIHAAWRYLVDRYNSGDPDVEYSRVRTNVANESG